MSTLLTPIDIKQMDKLEILSHAYVKEMMQYLDQKHSNAPAFKLSEHLSHYWSSDVHWPYFIEYNNSHAGFCFIRHHPSEIGSFDIDQFYVLDKYKRKGIGRSTLKKAVDLHSGNWIVRVLTKNSPALAFWLDAIQSICGETYTLSLEFDGENKMHFIRFNYEKA